MDTLKLNSQQVQVAIDQLIEENDTKKIHREITDQIMEYFPSPLSREEGDLVGEAAGLEILDLVVSFTTVSNYRSRAVMTRFG